jgi:hypothetical protein
MFIFIVSPTLIISQRRGLHIWDASLVLYPIVPYHTLTVVEGWTHWQPLGGRFLAGLLLKSYRAWSDGLATWRGYARF